MVQDEEERIYSLGEASRATGFARQTLRKLIQSGALEATTIRVPWGGKFKTVHQIKAKDLKPYIKEDCVDQRSLKNHSVLKRLEKLEKQVEEIIKRLT